MFLYHATKLKNLGSIMRDGLKCGIDGCIYFTTTQHHSVNWIDFSNFDGEDIVCFRVNVFKLDQSKIEKGTDHDPTFYKGITVKTYSEDIPAELLDLDNVFQFTSRRAQ